MKLALVTAGFHRLGGVIAARLAEAGWSLALHSRATTLPDRRLASALATGGANWHGFEADLADGQSAVSLLDAITTHFDRLPDLIVNNASLFEWDDAASVTAEALARHRAVNADAPVLLATTLANRLSEDSRACVINILDQRIAQPNGDQLSYTLSKQALAGATATLARALAPRVRVNGVAPGLVIPTDDYSAEQMALLTDMMPLGLLPTPDDIADAVLYLAEAKAVTGQALFVDGGAAMKSFDRDFVFLGT